MLVKYKIPRYLSNTMIRKREILYTGPEEALEKLERAMEKALSESDFFKLKDLVK